MSNERGLLVVISGPSGVGKSTIARAVEQRLGAVFSVSMTTRPKTAKDREGVDYFFVDEATFREAVAAGELLEWAQVFDRLYGTPREPVESEIAAGRIVVLEIDVEGAVQVREKHPQAFMIFIVPPSMEVLLERLRSRGREDEATIQRRYRECEREIERAKQSGAYDLFLVNDDLESAIERAVDAVRSARGSTENNATPRAGDGRRGGRPESTDRR